MPEQRDGGDGDGAAADRRGAGGRGDRPRLHLHGHGVGDAACRLQGGDGGFAEGFRGDGL